MNHTSPALTAMGTLKGQILTHSQECPNRVNPPNPTHIHAQTRRSLSATRGRSASQQIDMSWMQGRNGRRVEGSAQQRHGMGKAGKAQISLLQLTHRDRQQEGGRDSRRMPGKTRPTPHHLVVPESSEHLPCLVQHTHLDRQQEVGHHSRRMPSKTCCLPQVHSQLALAVAAGIVAEAEAGHCQCNTGLLQGLLPGGRLVVGLGVGWWPACKQRQHRGAL